MAGHQKKKYQFNCFPFQSQLISLPSLVKRADSLNHRICLYNFEPFKPHFYIVKLGSGVHIILLIVAQKHRIWVLVRTASARRF